MVNQDFIGKEDNPYNLASKDMGIKQHKMGNPGGRLRSIVALGVIVAGVWGISQVDSSRFLRTFTTYPDQDVDIEKKLNRTQLRTALSNAAKNMGHGIKFNKVYDNEYKLTPLDEMDSYLYTDVKVSRGFGRGIKLTIWGEEEEARLTFTPSGFISNKEVKQYFGKVSDYLPSNK